MAPLDVFLRETIATARERFPTVGLLLISVEDVEDTEHHEITMLTNMPPEEVEDVLAELHDTDDEIMPPGSVLN